MANTRPEENKGKNNLTLNPTIGISVQYFSLDEEKQSTSPTSSISSVYIGEPDLTGSQEITRTILKILYEKATIFADTNYWVITFYTLVLPTFIEAWGRHIPYVNKVGKAGTIIDTTCLLIISIGQLLTHTLHRSQVTKAQGILNFINTIQLPLLTFMNGGEYAKPSIVIAVTSGFLIQTIETIHSARLYCNKKYWLKDILSQIKILNKLIPALEKEVDMLSKLQQRFSKYAHGNKKERLDKYKEELDKLENQLLLRLNIIKAEDRTEELDIVQRYVNRQKANNASFINKLQNALDKPIESEDDQGEKEAQATLRKDGGELIFWMTGSIAVGLLLAPGYDKAMATFFALTGAIKTYQTLPTLYGWTRSGLNSGSAFAREALSRGAVCAARATESIFGFFNRCRRSNSDPTAEPLVTETNNI